MAARIEKAALRKNPTVEVEAALYDKNDHGPVICPDRRCGCDVQGVGPGTRTIHKEDGTTEQLPIAPYFRLPKNAVKLLLGHAAQCRFNIDATVTRLVAYSREVRKFDKDCEPMLARRDTGLVEYRIHILMDVLNVLGQEMRNNASAKRKKPEDPLVATRYQRIRRALRPYLRTVRAVNSLIARVNGDSSLADLVRLCFGSHTIAWRDFFYDIDDHGRLYNYLKEKGQFRRSFGADHDWPVAFAIQVQFVRAPAENQYREWEIACVGRLCQIAPGVKVFINPVIKTNDEKLARLLTPGNFFLVCTIPTITGIKEQTKQVSEPGKPKKRRYPRAWVRLYIDHRAQICAYTPHSDSQ